MEVTKWLKPSGALLIGGGSRNDRLLQRQRGAAVAPHAVEHADEGGDAHRDWTRLPGRFAKA